MGKNNHFINNQKKMAQQAESMVPATYASLAIALHEEFGFGYKRLSRAFARSQQIWDEHNSDLIGMPIKCYLSTGVQLMTDRQYGNAVKRGLIQEDDFR